MSQKVNMEVAGKPFSLETGSLALQANGAVVGTLGETVVLATAVMSPEPLREVDFFPLIVDYEEKYYAAGKIKSSRFMKREGRPSDEAVLAGRLVDRGLRPLFPEGMRNDVQVMLSILSVDEVNDPDVVAINAASAALMISDIPFAGPLAAVRIGRIEGKFIVNPSYEQRKISDMDVVVAGISSHIMMVEAGCRVVAEKDIIEAIKIAQAEIKNLVELQLRLERQLAPAKTEPIVFKPEQQIIEKVEEYCSGLMEKVLFNPDKEKRDQAIEDLKKEMLEKFEQEGLRSADSDDFEEAKKQILEAYYKLQKNLVRRAILENDRRVDDRPLNKTREVSAQIGLLPRTHGSALFNRGETQVLTTVTLGSTGDAQILDGMEDFEETKKRYMHHYNMPGFSTGEVSPSRGAGRREIGHGALAERAIDPVIPDKEKFPYTIRLVSEVLGSNGSTSMASTCGSSLALMDAGVPLSGHVGGVAMGLVLDEKSSSYKILTDIQGIEDYFGDMDFKVAGLRQGVTAMQLDIKTKGLTVEILDRALSEAYDARMHILDIMDKAIEKPRAELSKYAPRIESFMIDPSKIREVIGTGGKVINEIIEKTGVKIDIEDSGLVAVTSKDAEGMKQAVNWIKNLVREVQAGETFEGKVTRIMDFGAFVEVLPGKEGLVHISELAPYRVEKVEDVVRVGDIVKVLVTEIDPMGRINLSIKALAGGAVGSRSRQPYQGPRGDRSNFRNRRDRGFGSGSRGGFNRPRHRGR